MKRDNEIITGNDFINKFFDLQSIEPDYKNWTAEILKCNEPRYYRLLQIQSLLKYFGIMSVNEFVTGEFISKKSDEFCNAFLNSAKMYLRIEKPDNTAFYRQIMPVSFRKIFNYREMLNNLLYHQSGVLEASGLYFWTYKKIFVANLGLQNITEDINTALFSFIDYTNDLQIPISELKEYYGYLDVDLNMIDAQYA